MKKNFLLIFLLIGMTLFISCRKKNIDKIVIKIDNSYIKEDLKDISHKTIGENVEINWATENIQYIDYIELSEITNTEKISIKKYQPILNHNYNYKTNISVGNPKKYTINVVYKNGEKGKIHELYIETKEKNIIIDKFDDEIVHIYLPENYNKSDSKIIYILGSSNVFIGSDDENWNISSLLKSINNEYKDNIIIVSIIKSDDNSYYENIIPYHDQIIENKYNIKRTNSINYSYKLTKKIIPQLESKYFGYLKEKKDRMLIGYKEAGLFSMWYEIKNNEFENITLIAPVLWPSRNKIIYEPFSNSSSIWIDADINNWNYNDELKLVEKLKKSNYKYCNNLYYTESSTNIVGERLINPINKFINGKSSKIIDLEANLEIINIKEHNKVRFRLNVFAIDSDNTKYIVNNDVNYYIYNTNAINIDNNGNLNFTKEENSIINIKYENMSRKLNINYDLINKYIETIK